MNVEKDLKYALLSVLVLLAEFSFGKYIAIGGAVPMLTFCFCILSVTTEKDFSHSVILAIILGIVSDLLRGQGFGAYTVGFAFSALATMKLKDSIFTSGLLFMVVNIFLLTIPVELFYILAHIYDLKNINFWYDFLHKTIPTGIYNVVICMAFYPIHRKIFKVRR